MITLALHTTTIANRISRFSSVVLVVMAIIEPVEPA